MSKNKHDLLLINAKGLKKLVSRTPIYGEPNNHNNSATLTIMRVLFVLLKGN